jgi:hypothetical protein
VGALDVPELRNPKQELLLRPSTEVVHIPVSVCKPRSAGINT